MGFDLNRELTAAQAALQAAAKQVKKLAAVGVKPAEIAQAKRLYAEVVADRRALAARSSGYHDAVGGAHALLDEGQHLLSRLRRIGHFVLRHDRPADAQLLHDQLGIGARADGTAAIVGERAALVAKAAQDKRWAATFRRRGATAQAVKRLAEIGSALAEAGHEARPTDGALPPLVAQLLERVSYLRGAASLAFGTHSAEYVPFRAPGHRAKKKPPAPVPPQSTT